MSGVKQRAFCDIRPSMLKNPLLVRNKIGKAAPSTHDLPPSDYRYGCKTNIGEGVKEMFQNWEKIENPEETQPDSSRRKTEFKPGNDYIAMNRNAIRHGCRTSKEFREFQLKHPVMKKVVDSDSKIESNQNFHTRVVSMTHGIPTPVTSEMKECLTWYYGREAKERALAKRALEASTRARASTATTSSIRSRATRPTRASIGHTKVCYVAPRESDTFKIKRFADIDHYAIVDYWD
ncbi:hypothetical protein TVAG_474520 [Trichomonas vaginalis G3]|uniref:Uncharacterized protein n=1 Tax=Trichomonas vaginalis (strain ATCC PRA-98 / G3) TaxID=412133 RepID=A2ESY8_TRIV3|nr:protein of unknown function (DUF4483) [Trichomonas vaginalis G3]EAY04246.1 hypothetical protein TVAG_474520 [Trichomonas vaginalis G3]KAI5550013.1 protein of unknown function (DUF4483) [Trichomonas vaginalis G3]|eukprot:XP_001316469.1 hypothetical protein [Trichomonas vaginalis G3]